MSSEGNHLDPEVLAELQEDLLEPQPAAAAAAHLAGCARCQADDAALRAVRDQLAAAAAVGHAPDAVAARIDRALAEAGAEAAADTPAPAAAAVTVTPLSAAARGPRGMRLLQAAAAVALVLAAGALGISAWQGGDDRSGTATSAAAGSREAAPGHFAVLTSGTDYTEDTVVRDIPRLLGAPATARDGRVRDADSLPLSKAAGNRLSAAAALADCVKALAEDPVEPLVVDLARFGGQPAAVIVLPTPDDPQKADVWVVEPGCSQADAKMRYFARVDRR